MCIHMYVYRLNICCILKITLLPRLNKLIITLNTLRVKNIDFYFIKLIDALIVQKIPIGNCFFYMICQVRV